MTKAHSDPELAATGKRLAFAAGMGAIGSERKESVEMAAEDLMTKLEEQVNERAKQVGRASNIQRLK